MSYCDLCGRHFPFPGGGCEESAHAALRDRDHQFGNWHPMETNEWLSRIVTAPEGTELEDIQIEELITWINPWQWGLSRADKITGVLAGHFGMTECALFDIFMWRASPAGRFFDLAGAQRVDKSRVTLHQRSSWFATSGFVSADFDAADCARVREYVEVVNSALDELELGRFWKAMEEHWSGEKSVQSSLIMQRDAGPPSPGMAASMAIVTVSPVAMGKYPSVYRARLAEGGALAAFVAIALVIADSAISSWDPYVVGRAESGTDCACALCAGEWPDYFAFGLCGCGDALKRGRQLNHVKGTGGTGCRDYTSTNYRHPIDWRYRRCLPPDWGIFLENPAAAAAVAHAAEALCPMRRRSVWDERSPDVAAVECSESWWTDLGLRPPVQPASMASRCGPPHRFCD
jgi:hypothetical protein